jgi:prophage regulatory protein
MTFIKFSPSQLRRKMADGSFPQAVRLGGRTLAWARDEIEQWKQARLQERSV